MHRDDSTHFLVRRKLLGLFASAPLLATSPRIPESIADVRGAAPPQRWLAQADAALIPDEAVHFFQLPQRGSAPTTISIAPDGRLWFTESAGNRIGSIDPDGSGLVEHPLPNPDSSPRIIAIGADGNAWFSEHSGNRIGRMTAGGTYTGFAIPTPHSQPRAIALGADGNIWFGMFAAGKIGRITPEGHITEFDLPTANSGPRALSAGPDGNIWFSEYRAGRIGRITPRGQITEFPMPRPNSGPGDITAGADGAMWFVELNGADGLATDGNRIGHITMEGTVTEYRMPSQAGSPINITVGPDRNIWYSKGGALGRVERNGAITEFPAGENSRVIGLTAGADRQPPRRLVNRLYFADSANDRIGYVCFSALLSDTIETIRPDAKQ